MSHRDLTSRIVEAFAADAAKEPTITLRAGDAIDDYFEPQPFSPTEDRVSDAYLERHPCGVPHLDAASWRHYLPHLMEYALRHLERGSNVVDALLESLRPPDREPPRLGSLSPLQEYVVVAFLDVLAFSDESAHRELACLLLEEWWAPGALYRRVEE